MREKTITCGWCGREIAAEDFVRHINECLTRAEMPGYCAPQREQDHDVLETVAQIVAALLGLAAGGIILLILGMLLNMIK